jgi:hypothetical protein
VVQVGELSKFKRNFRTCCNALVDLSVKLVWNGFSLDFQAGPFTSTAFSKSVSLKKGQQCFNL